ncbi:MAG: YkgJ family cysteine cluster protein [Chitinophagales bacterium]
MVSSQFNSINSDTLDQIFSNAHSEVFKTFNCLNCANCCKNYSPIIEPEEINLLSTALNISAVELFENYVEMDEEGDFVFKSQPCPMLNLEDNKCTIYE